MPMLAPNRRLPGGSLPMAPLPVARQRCLFEPVLSANRPPFPKLDPAPVARTSVLAPFTLTRLPVPSFGGASEPNGSSGAVGVPPWPRPVPRCPWPPAEAGNSVHRSCSSARRPGCPVLVASERGFTPRRSRLRLVNRSRFPPRSARRRCSEDSVIRFRLACAPRYVGYIRECIIPGQGVFSNPQGYPRTFSSIPRIFSVVHRSCTGMSPDLRLAGSDFVDGSAVVGLNGRR